ncbi:MAG: tripartite tricarboxylate transporter TctB family protein [Thermodesulfobacteriota bacterium]
MENKLITNGAVFAFFLLMLIRAFELHEVKRFGEVGSGFWPLLVLSSATLFSFILLIRERKPKGEEKEKGEERKEKSSEKKGKKVFLCILCLFLYLFVMPFIGFILSTFFFILPFILVLGERRKWVLALSPPLLTIIIFLVFGKLISMPLPKGISFFAAFSRLFY